MVSYTKESSSQELPNYRIGLPLKVRIAVWWVQIRMWHGSDVLRVISCAHAPNFEPSMCDHATAPYQEGWSDLCWFEGLEFGRQLVLLLPLVLHFGSVPPDVWTKSVVCSSGRWRKDGGVVIHWKQSLPAADCGGIYRPGQNRGCSCPLFTSLTPSPLFILFYFILFYFILFYFILFLLFSFLGGRESIGRKGEH